MFFYLAWMKQVIRLIPIVLLLIGMSASACIGGKKVIPPYKVKERKAEILAADVIRYTVFEGKGEPVELSDRIKVHYHGMLEDGSVFDSSFDRGESIVFPVGGLIKGWQVGLAEVTVGSKVRLVIPAAAGYGDRELPSIPAGSTLIFDIEVINIESE